MTLDEMRALDALKTWKELEEAKAEIQQLTKELDAANKAGRLNWGMFTKANKAHGAAETAAMNLRARVEQLEKAGLELAGDMTAEAQKFNQCSKNHDGNRGAQAVADRAAELLMRFAAAAGNTAELRSRPETKKD